MSDIIGFEDVERGYVELQPDEIQDIGIIQNNKKYQIKIWYGNYTTHYISKELYSTRKEAKLAIKYLYEQCDYENLWLSQI